MLIYKLFLIKKVRVRLFIMFVLFALFSCNNGNNNPPTPASQSCKLLRLNELDFAYDGSNNLAKAESEDNKFTFNYTSNSIVEKYNPQSPLHIGDSTKTVHTLNANALIIKSEYYNSNNTLAFTTNYEYNSNGYMTKITQSYGEVTAFTYNSDNLTNIDVTHSNGDKSSYFISYYNDLYSVAYISDFLIKASFDVTYLLSTTKYFGKPIKNAIKECNKIGEFFYEADAGNKILSVDANKSSSDIDFYYFSRICN